MAGITYPNIPYGDTTYVDKINTNLSEIDTQLENIVKDPTKLLYGLSASAVPDDIFVAIKPLTDKVAIGSYTGTGTYGSENSNRLTFNFVPKVVVIYTYAKPSSYPFFYLSIYMNETLYGFSCSNGYSYANMANASVSGNTLSWYSTDSPYLNMSGIKYYYYCLG